MGLFAPVFIWTWSLGVDQLCTSTSTSDCQSYRTNTKVLLCVASVLMFCMLAEGLAVRDSAMDDADHGFQPAADTMELTRNRRGLFKYGMQVLNTLIPQIRTWYKSNPAAQKRIRIIAKELKPLIAMTLPKILEFYAKTPVLRKLVKKVMERVDKLKLREKIDMSGFESIKKEVMKIKDETK